MKKFNYLIGTHCKLTLKNLWTIIQHAPPIHGVFITKPKKKGKQAKKVLQKSSSLLLDYSLISL